MQLTFGVFLFFAIMQLTHLFSYIIIRAGCVYKLCETIVRIYIYIYFFLPNIQLRIIYRLAGVVSPGYVRVIWSVNTIVSRRKSGSERWMRGVLGLIGRIVSSWSEEGRENFSYPARSSVIIGLSASLYARHLPQPYSRDCFVSYLLRNSGSLRRIDV